MNPLILVSLSLCVVGCSVGSTREPAPTPQTPVSGLYALTAPDIDGVQQALSQYAGKVALVVNTASACGYTPQYEGLQALHTELASRGLVVVGFPSNDFGAQEPGNSEQIKSFCSTKYAVTFPMFAKVGTKAGAEQSPIYGYLGGATGKLPNWNFCKYLVGKDGTVIAFYPSKVAPNDAELRAAILAALAAK